MPVGSRRDVVDQSFVPTLQKSWLPSSLITSRRADDFACNPANLANNWHSVQDTYQHTSSLRTLVVYRSFFSIRSVRGNGSAV